MVDVGYCVAFNSHTIIEQVIGSCFISLSLFTHSA